MNFNGLNKKEVIKEFDKHVKTLKGSVTVKEVYLYKSEENEYFVLSDSVIEAYKKQKTLEAFESDKELIKKTKI
jgi:hypothetical protein